MYDLKSETHAHMKKMVLDLWNLLLFWKNNIKVCFLKYMKPFFFNLSLFKIDLIVESLKLKNKKIDQINLDTHWWDLK